jgi:putative ABC transport system ATP-binding protein
VTPLVTVRQLHKVYRRGAEQVDVLQGVNLDIPSGDFLALMGPSGSGKTTMLNLLGGLDRPSDGAIEITSTRIDQMSGKALAHWRAEHVGFVFQLVNLVMVTHDLQAAAAARRVLHLDKGRLIEDAAA